MNAATRLRACRLIVLGLPGRVRRADALGANGPNLVVGDLFELPWS